MFKMLGNLAKATVSVALTPVAVVVDTFMIIPDSCHDREMFSRTGGLMKNAGECVEESLKPDKE